MIAPAGMEAVILSLRIGATAAALALPLAYALGWLLARGSFAGRALVEAVVMLPLIVPPVLAGWALLPANGAPLPGGAVAVGIAAAMAALPLMVFPIMLAIAGVDRGLEQAARTLGARPWQAFITVTLPLSLPGVLAAALLGVVRASGEVAAAAMLLRWLPGEASGLSPGLALVWTGLALLALAGSGLLLRRGGWGGAGHDL